MAHADIFQVQCLIKNISIKFCARIESGVKQLLAIITSDGDVVFYYTFGELPAIIKRIPWFSDAVKSIKAICFDPTATWLLIAVCDGSLYILPALSLVDKNQRIDCKWCLNDLTCFSKPLQILESKPTAITWWQTLDCNQNGLVGYDSGIMAVISLTDGRCLATCTISEAVSELFLCQDNSLEIISLLINGESGQQWKLVLEQHSVGYIWPSELNTNNDESTRSRLFSLGQSGVNKLASLKQRLIEGRSQRRDSFASDTTTESSHSDSTTHSTNGPELLPHLGDTYFSPQYSRDRYLFSALYKPSNLLTVHALDLDSAPLYTHKLMEGTKTVLLTDKLIFAINEDRSSLSVISTHLSECRLEGDNEFNENAVLGKFTFDREKVLKIYKLADLNFARLKKSREEHREKLFEMPKSLDDLNVRKPRIDTCVLVTDSAIYKIIVSVSPVAKFVRYIVDENNLAEAEKLSIIFSLNLQQLLESCGDLLISKGSFHSGIILYKQAKLHILKRVLKLAVSADCKTLLKFVHLCLNSSSKIDMSMATKIHIGNLAVMAYTELVLRQSGLARISSTKDFMNFLRYEEYYDQVLAVNVACQAGQWNIAALLAKTRGFKSEVIAALAQILRSSRAPSGNDIDFLIALSEPSLTQSLLLDVETSQVIFHYVRSNVEHFPVDILQRFTVQLDPSQPCAIPVVGRYFYSNKFKNLDHESVIINSLDSENSEGESCVVKDLVETFIIVLLNLISKTKSWYDLSFLDKIELPEVVLEEFCMEKFPEVQPLGCGFEHAAIVRNGHVYTTGVSNGGCLGLGPLLIQSSSPKLVRTLADLKVKAISVSCGRKHTLALTDYGVYAWGSNTYGQIGLGPFVQETPEPEILRDLAPLKIVQIVAGQYHSMALTSAGQVYTWGWGIHGQLGHGTFDNEYQPRMLDFHDSVVQVAAGHAHSLILTSNGELYGFGSNVFSQLGCGKYEKIKYAKSIRVVILQDITMRVEKVSAGYFHNIALCDNQQKVFIWGASPQEVRMFQTRHNQKEKQNGITAVKHSETWKDTMLVFHSENDTPVQQTAVGYRHSAILYKGKVFFSKTKDDPFDTLTPSARMERNEGELVYSPWFDHISCGFDYTMALNKNGKVLAWGSKSMAQTILGRAFKDDNDGKKDGKIVWFKNTKRIVKFPGNQQNYPDNSPVEVPGLPTMAITFDPPDHRLLFPKKNIRSLISIANDSIANRDVSSRDLQSRSRKSNVSPIEIIRNCPSVDFGSKTLHYVLETYHGVYDSENILFSCLKAKNYQAASKLAMLDGHFNDSLTYQFEAFANAFAIELAMLRERSDFFASEIKDKGYIELVEHINRYNEKAAVGSVQMSNSFDRSNGHSPARILSASSSLDSIRHWDEMEHQGGCESPCDVDDLGDVRQNISQYVQSLRNNQGSPPISSVSKLISQVDKPNSDSSLFGALEIDDPRIRNVIETISRVVEFYVKKIHLTENHILMQNILMKCIEFWLSNNLPVVVLEGILLKNLDKYFYPLSILLFCKNFTSHFDDDDKIIEKNGPKKNSVGFLKEFSTKFCLQLCSMVLENVNKT